MSDIIRLLPDSVANQIAAGEVIQRPSSVIKELVENSIDAGATLIQVVVVEAGKTSIQVIDNGKGMSVTDARLAFERHATSKIKEASDLFSLQTMGFRGEALASIVAVAQVELHTRTADDELGVNLIIEGSRVKEQEPIACPVGCNFLVKNLFFNIPARRKFLKSNQTELSNILTEFERIALANPQIAFTLHSGDNMLLNLPAGNFKQRILNIFGKKMDAQLISINVDTSLARISGYVGSPKGAKKKGAHQYFFVNGRYMRHPYFNKAVQSAYERLIPDGEQISYFINFEVEPAEIDVNIHPSKTEIKFQSEQAIWPILLASVRESLGKFNAVPTIDFDTANRPNIPTFHNHERDSSLSQPLVHINSEFNPFEEPEKPASNPFSNFDTYTPKTTVSPSRWKPAFDTAFAPDETSSLPEINAQVDTPMLYDDLPAEERCVWEKDNAVFFQFRGRYIVSSSTDGLLLVDQHRAHFRILYDLYKRQMEEQKGISQGLLFPQLLQLPSSESTLFESMLDDLSSVGFEISNLGGSSYSILGIPAGTEGLDPVSMLQSLVDDAKNGQAQIKEQIDHLIALTLSRRAAIPVGQLLDNKEMADLLEKLFKSSNPNFTPDGATIMANISNASIEGMLG